MAHVTPLSREELPEFEDAFQLVDERMGFLPNSFLTMARRPEIMSAFAQLAAATRTGTVSPALKELVSLVASTAAGCRYCQAHGAAKAQHQGADAEKTARAWEYETCELFTDAERAALRLAHHAALVPNEATAEDFAELSRHFDDGEIVEIVATISLFGFLNRWNDTMATELEDDPIQAAASLLGDKGWEPGKHAGSASGARSG